MNYLNTKKGVSLVTVLLFMMVATIAATATFKWLSSAGSSSAARMKINAARELAVSGIEASRSWMQYNGNDVGVVIKQYFKNEGKPILLNPVLSKKFSESNKDSVWLVGVSVDRQNYKLKILSVATLDANTKYSEVAIMNVGGLFQVSLPTTAKKVNLSEAFHGALGTADSIIVDAAVIKQQPEFTKHGTQMLNGIKSSKYLVLDGSFYVNQTANVRDLYVTGDVDFGYSLSASGDVYVGGDLYGSTTSNTISVTGSTYIKGDFKPEEKSEYVKKEVSGYGGVKGGKFKFGSNLTIKGNLDHFKGSYGSFIIVDSNLVVEGRLKIKSDPDAKDSIRVKENAYISGYELFPGAEIPISRISRTYIGSKDHDNKVYIGGMSKYENQLACEDNGYKCTDVPPPGIFYVAYQGSFGTVLSTERDLWKADTLPQYAEKLSEKVTSSECGEVAKSPIQFNTEILKSSFIRNSEKPMGCDNRIWSSADNYVDLINTCYDIASTNGSLYDKNWLVLEFNNFPRWVSTNKKLEKNIIFVIHGSTVPDGGFNLPQTTELANVVLYLPEGWKNKDEGESIRTTLNAEDIYYRYFIYSAGDIGSMTASDKAKGITGAIFMEGCSVFNSLKKSVRLVANFDQTMVDLLASANIICNNDGSKTCSGFTGVTPDYVGGAVYSSVDEFYVTTSPQLSISMESQYKNTEYVSRSDKDFEVVKPSAVVLPRVVYLTQDPLGRLSDYYNVIGVNGSKQTKNAAKMSCPAPLNSGTQLLYDNVNLLPEGKYICSYEEAAQKEKIPVFVVVEGLMNETPDIHFEKDRIPLTTGSSKMVSLVFQGEGSYTATIKAPSAGSMPHGWEPLDVQAGVTKESESGDYATYKVEGNGSTDPIPVFKVTAGEYAEKASVSFQLITPCKGCKITKPDIATVSISNMVTVERREFYTSYCSDMVHANSFKEKYGTECSEALSRPNCETLAQNMEWVRAKGCRIADGGKNEKWNCNTNDVGETWLESMIPNHKECDVFVSDSVVKLSSSGDSYYLPATLKRKMFKFYMNFKGSKGGTGIAINVKRSNALDKDTVCYNDCSINVYANDTVYTTKKYSSSDKFSYWTCNGDDCGVFANKSNTTDTSKIIITNVDTITYHFNEKDEHCFYDDFSKTQEKWCGKDEVDCFDYCKSGDKCKIGAGRSNSAKWFLPIKNKTKVFSIINEEMKADEFRRPEVKGGKMTAPNGFSTKIIDRGYHPTVVLNSAKAGYNGQMTTLFEMPTITSQGLNKLFNGTIDDGFIFRSNDDASEYFLLSIASGCEGLSCHTRAKVCQTGGLDGKSNAPCVTESFKTGLTGNANIHESKFGRSSLNIDIKDDIVTVTLSHSSILNVEEHRPAVARIDLKKFNNLYNDDNHSRVGIKLGIPGVISDILDEIGQALGAENTSMSFAAYDIGWKSYNYEESCWDTPSVSCSFKSNYAGGMVPKDSLVTPWVGMSSWFDGKNCEATYYYNGCDLEDDLYVSGWKLFGFSVTYGSGKLACALTRDKGFYLWHARQLEQYNRGKLNSESYQFLEEGYHGYPYNGPLGKGTVKEASVIVRCKGRTTLDEDNVRTYDASCGDFIVGKFEQCSESYNELLERNTVCHDGGEPCVPDWNVSEPINVRDAVIHFSVKDLNSGEVDVYLKSDEGILSDKLYTITESGDYDKDVSLVSNAEGFNPQKVVGLAFIARNTNSFNVTHVQSYCKYAFGLTCKPTAYDATKKEWVVGADVLHSEKADKCKVIPLNGKVPSSSVPGYEDCGNFEQRIYQNDVYGQAVEENYSFRVVAYDAQGEPLDSCDTEPFIAPAFNLTCNVSKEKIEQGYGLPSFSFSMDGCPEEGCPYTIKFPNDSTVAKTGESNSGICPEGGCNNYNIVNATRDEVWSQGQYSYDIDVYGQKCIAGNTFEILPEPPKATCKDSKARIENGKFVADVIYDTEQHSTWKGEFNISVSGNFVVADPLGNVLLNEEVESDNPNFEKALPASMATCKQGWCKYVAILKLHGGALCPAEMIAYAPMNELNCPEVLTDKSPSEVIDLLDSVKDCQDGAKCNWVIERGFKTIDTEPNYNGLKLSFSGDNGAVGEKRYKLVVTRQDSINETTTDIQKKECEFSVIYNNSALSNQCGFVGNLDAEWGGNAKIWLQSNCENCPYKIFTPSGKEWGNGYTSSTEGEPIEHELIGLVENGTYKIVVNGETSSPCEAPLNMVSIGSVECKLDKNILTVGKTATMTATLPCKTEACNWEYEIENISNGEKYNGTTGPNVKITSLGVGSYRFKVNGEQVCSFDIEKGKDCYFDKPAYNYNEEFKFIVEGVTAERFDKYTFTGKSQAYFEQEYSNSTFTVEENATFSGTYEFSGGGKECSDELVIIPPTIECKRTTYEQCFLVICSNKYRLELTATGCHNNCKYTINGGNEGTISSQPITINKVSRKDVNSSSTYTVKVSEGNETTCIDAY